MTTTPTRRDAFGSTVGFVLGILVGLLVAAPAFPDSASVMLGGIELGSLEAGLLAAGVAVLAVPFAVCVLYFLFASAE